MIVVDSSVWIDHFRDNRTTSVLTLRATSSQSTIIVGDLVLMELLQGARDDRHASEIEDSLRKFIVAPMMSEEVVQRAARIYRQLRGDGITIRKTIDLIIATFCLINGYTLLQDDRDFQPIAQRFGLRIA